MNCFRGEGVYFMYCACEMVLFQKSDNLTKWLRLGLLLPQTCHSNLPSI